MPKQPRTGLVVLVCAAMVVGGTVWAQTQATPTMDLRSVGLSVYSIRGTHH